MSSSSPVVAPSAEPDVRFEKGKSVGDLISSIKWNDDDEGKIDA